jgi:hypothetical protein
MRKKGGLFYFSKIIMILAIVSAGFFCTQKIEAGQNILISEIQIYPAGSRFIELYNPNDFSVDLTNWSVKRKTSSGKEYSLLVSSRLEGKFISPKGYFLLTSEETYNGSITPDAIWAKSYTITKDNTIILYNNKIVVDKVGFGLAVDCENNCFLNPDENQSVQRKFQNNIFIDTDNNGEDFKIENCPSPKAQSTVCQNENSDDSGDQDNNATSTPVIIGGDVATSTNPIASSSSSSEQKNNFGDVVINELVSDPTDDDVEWIELYNKAYREIDLTGWWLEDGSKAKTNLSGNLGAGGSSRYKVIEKPVGSLNNSGDIITLYDASGKIIDQITYGNWDDGNIIDNAPAASDPGSTARKFDGCNTYNSLNDFAITLKPTKGASNIIQVEDEISSEAKAGFDFSSDILISEILPNPTGDDTKLEFIEIYNASKREVNLTGWSLSNEDNKKVNLEKIATSTIIKAGEYLAFYRPQTKIVLHNDQGQVKLFQPLADKPFMTVNYKNVKEGFSYNIVDYKIKDEWTWSETPTPGAANIFKTINHPPEVEFSLPKGVLVNQPAIFDSSDTVDRDDDKLKFNWDFGDGSKNNLANPEHTYLKVGIYKVKLEVSDGQEIVIKEKNITVVNNNSEFEKINDIASSSEDVVISEGGDIIINEILPNPKGADIGNEWVEFKNQSSDKINLLNWRIENSNGKYKFNEAQIIESGAFYVLKNNQSKLSFKNADDVISLYNGNNELVDSVEYFGAIQDEVYARGANNKWFWTTTLTPGQENIISLANSEAVIKNQVLGVKINAAGYIETDLEKIRGLEIGSLVKVKGTVAVKPGILGAQIFYIVGSPGMQIYNYKKDFPALKVGDYIEVTGELAQTQGEFRIKTKEKSDIKIIDNKPPPLALAMKGDEISEENVGQLIIITGEITDKKSASLYIDDGSDEVFIYIKQNTGINTKNLAAGQKISVNGILSKTQTGLRLLPRFQEDIVSINSANELEPQVLGEVSSAGEWDLAKRDKKLELFKYLLIISGGVIVLLIGLFIRVKRKK